MDYQRNLVEFSFQQFKPACDIINSTKNLIERLELSNKKEEKQLLVLILKYQEINSDKQLQPKNLNSKYPDNEICISYDTVSHKILKVNAIKDIIDQEMSEGQFIYEVFRITSDKNQLKKIKISHGFSSIMLRHFGYNVEDI